MSLRSSSLINMDTGFSSFSDNFYRLFNNLTDENEESLVSLLEEKIIAKAEEEKALLNGKRSESLQVEKPAVSRRSFNRKRENKEPNHYYHSYEQYEAFNATPSRARSSSLAVNAGKYFNESPSHYERKQTSPRPSTIRRSAITENIMSQPSRISRNRTCSMPLAAKPKESKEDKKGISVCGCVCFVLCLCSILLIDIHSFRTQKKKSFCTSNCTVVFSILMGSEWVASQTVPTALTKAFMISIQLVHALKILKFDKIIEKFKTIDVEITLFEPGEICEYKEKRESISLWILVVCGVSTLVITSIVAIPHESQDLSTTSLIFIHELTYLVPLSIDLQLFGLCQIIGHKFAILNHLLQSFHFNNTSQQAWKINKIFSIHSQLLELVGILLETYQLQILIGLCLSFLHLLLDIYSILFSIMNESISWMDTLNLRPLNYIFRLILISHGGSLLKIQATKIQKLFSEILPYVENKELQLEVRVYLMKLQNNKFCMSIYSFLHLDLSLIISPMLSQTKKSVDSGDYYRLRSFSITPNGICKLGDTLKDRRSRSSCSVDSTTSRTSNQQITEENNFNSDVPVFAVAMLGAPNVGKTTLSYQFTTSEYICAYDTSLDEEFGQKTVSISINGKEAELNIIDIPAEEISIETFCLTYNVDVFVIVYSVVDTASFKIAEEMLSYLWNNDYMSTKAVILVGNKADLERRREIPTNTGRKLALTWKCKFIEISSGLDHNVDELLVGIFKQVMLNPKRIRKNLIRGRMSNGKYFIKHLLKFGKGSKSCENLYVL